MNGKQFTKAGEEVYSAALQLARDNGHSQVGLPVGTEKVATQIYSFGFPRNLFCTTFRWLVRLRPLLV